MDCRRRRRRRRIVLVDNDSRCVSNFRVNRG